MRTRLKFLAALIMLISLSVTGCLFGGDDSSDSTPASYTVTFDSQGGSAVTAATVTANTAVTEPAAPTRSYYTFGGWYKEAACTNAWTFATDAVTANITLFAKWTHNLEDFAVNPIRYDDADGSLDVAGEIFDLHGTANGDVYVVGEFEQFKGQTIRSVAKLSGSTWSQVGTDLDPNSTVHSICITPSGDIYIGGLFGHNTVFGQTAANGPKAFAKLTSGTWDNVTNATTDNTDVYYSTETAQVSDIICASDGKIYVVGKFAYAGGTAASNVRNSFAILDSGAWTGFDNIGFQKNSTPGSMREIFFDEAGTNLYANGDFNNITGTAATSGYWAYWNGSAWGAPSSDYGAGHPVRFKADGSCYKKATSSESESYFAGVSNDGGTTYTTDPGYTYPVVDPPKNILVFGPDGTPYRYGIFTSVKWNVPGSTDVRTVTANCIVKWNGTEWVAFGNLPTSTVKQVSRVFFTPNGDMWITTRNDMSEYAFGPNYGTNLYRIKK